MYIVSECLLGVPCKYNGGSNDMPVLRKYLEGKSYVAVCPETLGGLSAPRPPAEIQGGRVRNKLGEDVTDSFRLGAEKAWKKACDTAQQAGEPLTQDGVPFTLAILKARSPSCGSGAVYDGTFSHTTIRGDGIFAELLKEKGIPVITEEEFLKKEETEKYTEKDISAEEHTEKDINIEARS